MLRRRGMGVLFFFLKKKQHPHTLQVYRQPMQETPTLIRIN